MDFKRTTETVGGVEYTLIEMDAGMALKIQDEFIAKSKDPSSALEWGRTILAASLRRNLSDLMALPVTHFQAVMDKLGPIALEINGFKVAEQPGEAQAGESPAELISETSSQK